MQHGERRPQQQQQTIANPRNNETNVPKRKFSTVKFLQYKLLARKIVDMNKVTVGGKDGFTVDVLNRLVEDNIISIKGRLVKGDVLTRETWSSSVFFTTVYAATRHIGSTVRALAYAGAKNIRITTNTSNEEFLRLVKAQVGGGPPTGGGDDVSKSNTHHTSETIDIAISETAISARFREEIAYTSDELLCLMLDSQYENIQAAARGKPCQSTKDGSRHHYCNKYECNNRETFLSRKQSSSTVITVDVEYTLRSIRDLAFLQTPQTTWTWAYGAGWTRISNLVQALEDTLHKNHEKERKTLEHKRQAAQEKIVREEKEKGLVQKTWGSITGASPLSSLAGLLSDSPSLPSEVIIHLIGEGKSCKTSLIYGVYLAGQGELIIPPLDSGVESPRLASPNDGDGTINRRRVEPVKLALCNMSLIFEDREGDDRFDVKKWHDNYDAVHIVCVVISAIELRKHASDDETIKAYHDKLVEWNPVCVLVSKFDQLFFGRERPSAEDLEAVGARWREVQDLCMKAQEIFATGNVQHIRFIPIEVPVLETWNAKCDMRGRSMDSFNRVQGSCMDALAQMLELKMKGMS